MRFVLFLLFCIFLIVPMTKMILDPLVQEGGIIAADGTLFEIAIWRFWWIGLLILLIGWLVWYFGNKRPRV